MIAAAMSSTFSHWILFVLGVAVLALFAFADISAIVAHLLILVGALIAFDGWAMKLGGFVGGNVLGLAVGLGTKALLSRPAAPTRTPGLEPPAATTNKEGDA